MTGQARRDNGTHCEDTALRPPRREGVAVYYCRRSCGRRRLQFTHRSRDRFCSSAIPFSCNIPESSTNDPSSLFFSKTQELCLIQHVTEVTRIRQHQAPSTLDYVFTDEENLIDSIAYEPPLAKSCIWMWLYLDGTCCLLYKM